MKKQQIFNSFQATSHQILNYYAQIPGGEGVAWAVDPNWDPNKLEAEYDRGIVHLDKDPNTGKYVDEVVIPIQILAISKI